MLIASLGSGSAGNSCLFEADGTRILVDAGFGIRQTQHRLKALGREITSIDAIVVTHEHSDHVHGAEKISQKFGIPLYLTQGTLDGSRIDAKSTPVRVFRNNSSFRIGDLEIHACRVVHDAADPACFVVESGDGTRGGIASDLGCVDDVVVNHLRGCDALLFEANHDLDMLRTGSYPWNLKRRIMSRHGHLSNDDSVAALERMLGDTVRHLCLIHLSERNNHESIVRAQASELLSRLGATIDLRVASQHAPMDAIDVARRGATAAQKRAQLSLF